MSKSFEILYQSYIQDVFRYLYSLCHDYHLAEDLANETFYRAYLFMEDCQQKVKPWLFKVAYNTYVDFRRKHGRILIKDSSFFEQLKDMKTPEEVVVSEEELQWTLMVMDQLPENQRQAILLHDFHGLMYKEAAEIMQITLSHFKVLLFRARLSMRERRKEETEGE